MEQVPLLATKLYIPPVRPELVSRPRLIESLNAGLNRKLTLISAPAGFGKTTLVSEWVHAMGRDVPPIAVAWLSLDKGDNDSTRFLAYVITALRTLALSGVDGTEARQQPAVQQEPVGCQQVPVGLLGKGVLSALRSPQPPPAEAVLIQLINEITAVPDRILLVLDDYHLIEAQPIHDALTFLLEHLPPQMHLVIATRENPHLPLARLRARGQLTELRATDLRFASSEAAEFLNQVMGLDLSAEDIVALETRTEGWIAGLHLAAISMQGHKDASSFVRSFTGSHRFVLDYLIEEVLEQQSKSVQTFLLQTSILNRLTGSLCDALTGQDNGRATLEMLERANLFIVPLDEERCWYRYHHLFAGLLQQSLNIAHPNWVNNLHSKAVIWYEMSGDFSEAIHHALAIDDIKTATRLIEKGALEALEHSELRFILNWVDRLPDIDLREHPWLFVYHSWALLLSGQVEAVRLKLEHSDWLLDSVSEDDESQKQEILGYIAGLKAILAVWQRDLAVGVNFANQALENLPDSNWIRGYCAITIGTSFALSGNLHAAKDAYAESCSVGKASGNELLAVTGACNLAHALDLVGRTPKVVPV